MLPYTYRRQPQLCVSICDRMTVTRKWLRFDWTVVIMCCHKNNATPPGCRRFPPACVPLKSYQACGAVKPGKVELNSTFRHRGHRAAGHLRCRNRMFPLKIELPPVCPSATAGSTYGSYSVVTVIWKPGLNKHLPSHNASCHYTVVKTRYS